MSQLNIKAQTSGSTTTPPTGYKALYYDSGASQWKYIDETGTVFIFNSTVTTVSIVAANGFAGSVATATTTPAITLTTSITGLLKGNGTAISAASAGTDYVVPSGSITGTATNITAASNATLTTLSVLSLPGTQVTGTVPAATTAGSATTATSATTAGSVTGTNVVTNTNLSQMAAHTYKGNNTGSTANATDITSTQLTADLNAATTSLQGMMSAADKQRADNWYNKAIYNVLDNGISSTNTGAQNVTAWNALMTVLANSTATVFFPPGVYDIASVCNIPAGVHIRVMGAGTTTRTSDAFGTIIRTTSATADMFTCGDWYDQFTDLTFRTSTTRSAGSCIVSGDNVGIEVINCNFNAAFNGVNFSGGANSGNLGYVTNCHFTDSVNFSIKIDGTNCNAIITACTADCSSASVAHLEVNACGSLLVGNCDFIRATNNLRLNPDSGTKGVFSVYCINTFFDTAAGSSVKFLGGATGTNIQRVKFINCWFSGSVTGCEFSAVTSTNKATAIDFVGCDIYSNSSNGILATEVQDFSLNNCRVAGNVTAGVNTAATTGSVTKFNIQNCVVGPTAGVGANGIGINIQAGTYGAYTVTGNIITGNTSSNNILDAGSVATTDLKLVTDNLGHLLKGAIATLSAPLSIPVTTETLVLAARIPANAVSVGQVFRIKGITVSASTDVITWNCKVGANGTTADTAAITIAGTASVANGRSLCEFYLVVRSLGAPGTVYADGTVVTGAVAASVTSQKTAAAAATTNATTNAPWFITLTISETVSTSIVQIASIEAL